jgi:hypothetical protein
MPPTLLRYLMMNRAGTRIGRATWVYLALWAVFLVVVQVLVHLTKAVALETVEPLLLWFALLSPAILLLNRFDNSGPTVEERRAAARAEAALRERNWVYRFGIWLGRKFHKE